MNEENGRFWRFFEGWMCLFSNKTEKNRKKPVETEEIGLTKFAEKPKVKCGTVLRTRMNIGDSAFETDAILTGEAGQASDR